MGYIPTDTLSKFWLDYWSLYKNDIVTLLDNSYNDEKISGFTCKNYKLSQYFLAFELVVMIYNELNTYTGITEDYINTKYNIADKRHKLACNHIDLYAIYNIFGISFRNGSGIEGMGIEQTFKVEHTTNTGITSSIDILSEIGMYCSSIFD